MKIIRKNPNIDLHQLTLPFRMCSVAPSGSGKTNFLINLLEKFCHGEGTFASICIITRNKDEPLYQWLGDKSDQIMIKEGLQNTPKLDDFDKKTNQPFFITDEKNVDKRRAELGMESMFEYCKRFNIIYKPKRIR